MIEPESGRNVLMTSLVLVEFKYELRPWGEERPQGRPKMHWCDDITKTAGVKWIEAAQDRRKWHNMKEAYTHRAIIVTLCDNDRKASPEWGWELCKRLELIILNLHITRGGTLLDLPHFLVFTNMFIGITSNGENVNSHYDYLI
ncbi:hypothetical protein ACJJTC_000477 [Scirpophaga incertulas]